MSYQKIKIKKFFTMKMYFLDLIVAHLIDIIPLENRKKQAQVLNNVVMSIK